MLHLSVAGWLSVNAACYQWQIVLRGGRHIMCEPADILAQDSQKATAAVRLAISLSH